MILPSVPMHIFLLILFHASSLLFIIFIGNVGENDSQKFSMFAYEADNKNVWTTSEGIFILDFLVLT